MKKILYLIIFVLSFITFNKNVFASTDYITLGNKINDVKLYLKTDVFDKNTYMYEMKNKTTGQYVYCIEPGVMLYDGYYQGSITNTTLSHEDWLYVNLIAYYGYGYQDRTDLKWYIATQYMIWDYILKDKGEIYFVDANNEKQEKYTEEIKVIEKDIIHNSVLPSFALKDNYEINMTSKLDESITFIDENNVLDEYNIMTNYPDDTDVLIKGNEITVTFHHHSTNVITFQRKMDAIGLPKIYCKDGSQTVFSRGVNRMNTGTIQVYVENPGVHLIKKGDNNQPLSGAQYGLYDASSNFKYDILTTNELGYAEYKDLEVGDYYLKELVAPFGYLLNEEPIYFTIQDKDITIETRDESIKKKIQIEKYLETYDGKFITESNAKFKIINTDTNELVWEGVTNELGKIELLFAYGNYELIQVEGTPGYQLMENKKFTIDEQFQDQVWTIYNKEIMGNLKVIKKDNETKEPILDSTTFKIKNMKTNEYFNIDGNDLFKTIDGVLLIKNIPYGSYIIEEIEAPNGYYLLKEPISFQITDDKLIELEFLNKKQSGIIEITKLDYDTKKPLEGVLFGLYDKNFELIQEAYTNQEGVIRFQNISDGNYYIKELSSLDHYEVNDHYVAVSVQDHIKSLFTFYNRFLIDVPITGTNEFLIGFFISTLLLLFGVILCNYAKD